MFMSISVARRHSVSMAALRPEKNIRISGRFDRSCLAFALGEYREVTYIVSSDLPKVNRRKLKLKRIFNSCSACFERLPGPWQPSCCAKSLFSSLRSCMAWSCSRLRWASKLKIVWSLPSGDYYGGPSFSTSRSALPSTSQVFPSPLSNCFPLQTHNPSILLWPCSMIWPDVGCLLWPLSARQYQVRPHIPYSIAIACSLREANPPPRPALPSIAAQLLNPSFPLDSSLCLLYPCLHTIYSPYMYFCLLSSLTYAGYL